MSSCKLDQFDSSQFLFICVQQKPAWGTDVPEDVQLDPEKLKAAISRHEEAERQLSEQDERKRKYNSLADADGVTNEEMEAYRMRKARADDPMELAKQSGGAAGGYDYV